MRKSNQLIFGTLLITALALAACAPDAASEGEISAQTVEETDTLSAADVEEQAAIQEPVDETAAPRTFEIVAGESEVRFIIDEVLNGNPNTVVGATNIVTGNIVADFSDPATADIGTIQVDISTLLTDHNLRNRMLHGRILESNEFQFVEFTPTAFEGLPETISIGTTFEVAIIGDLTLHGVTRQVTFNGTITPQSESRLEGSVSATVLYQDFEIIIIRLPPQIASVEDEVILEIDFVALAS